MRRLLAVFLAVAVTAGCSSPTRGHVSPPNAEGSASIASAPPPVELNPLSKVIGVALPDGYAGFQRFSSSIGATPRINEVFLDWCQGLPGAEVWQAWKGGVATLISWQPTTLALGQISQGAGDAVVAKLADEVKAAGLPVLMSFAHEFNGNWYPWGTQAATPAQFVAAWRHVHDVFVQHGATNVKWVWSPNIVNPVPNVSLAKYWPGDQYVDFAGMVGYWTGALGENSWAGLVLPTEKVIRSVTQRPIIITETGAQQGSQKAAWVTAMLRGFRSDPNIVAMVYFDYGFKQGKRADWTLEDDSAALAAWKAAQ